MIREKEADRLCELGVQSVQVSIYSHRPEVHDAITKLPGSLKRSLAGIRLLRERGMKVIIANVLMRQNLQDYPGVVALAKELGAELHHRSHHHSHDGRRPLHPQPGNRPADLRQVFRTPELVGNVEEFCAPPPAVGDDVTGWPAVQRQPYLLLHFPLRRCLPLRAVSAAHRQRAQAEDSWISGSTRRK